MLTVIYPGSFDPVTNGHLHVLQRASRLFAKVIVAIARNTGKDPFFTVDDRLTMLRECCAELPNVEVGSFEGLLVHYAQSKGATAVVKGLRAVSDFEFEFQQAMLNRTLDGGLETIFLPADSDHQFLSSSIVREIAMLGGDASPFVPPCVAPYLQTLRVRGSK